MKAIKTLALIAVSIFFLTGCQKDYSGPAMRTVKINVARDAWRYSGLDDNNYYMATVQMPEINASVFRNGLVKMYRVYDWNQDNAAQTELPYVRLNEYEAEDGNWYFFTETIDYQFSAGEVTFFYTMSDFNYELDDSFNPGAMEFRCVIVY